MSTETATPAAVASPVAAATPAAVTQAAAPPPSPDPLAAARKEAERELLKELGFETKKAATEARARLSELEKERLTAEERAKVERQELESRAARFDPLLKELVAMQEAAISRLSPEAQKGLQDVAGDDPVERAKYLRFLAVASSKTEQSAAEVKPLTTSADGTPPPAAKPETAYESYEKAAQKNPVLGAAVLQMNGTAIDATRPAPAKG